MKILEILNDYLDLIREDPQYNIQLYSKGIFTNYYFINIDIELSAFCAKYLFISRCGAYKYISSNSSDSSVCILSSLKEDEIKDIYNYVTDKYRRGDINF